MSTLKKEIECLERIRHKYGSFFELCEFLVHDNVISNSDINTLGTDQEIVKNLRLLLKQKEGKEIISLIFTWQVLPSEIISILIITQNKSKTFIFGE